MPSITRKPYPLSTNQIHYLKLLYKFRFTTAKQLCQYLHTKDVRITNLTLRNLLEHKYIGRYYDTSYKLQGKPAIYYLELAGIRALKEQPYSELTVYRSIYKDKAASEQKIQQYVTLGAICNQLKIQYGDKLTYFSKSELAPKDYNYFPQPPPDAYIQLSAKGQESEYFLDYLDASRPVFTSMAQIARYVEYVDGDDWPEDERLPAFRFVCETDTLEKRLLKRIARLSKPIEMNICTTTLDRQKSGDEEVWRNVTEPNEMVSFVAPQS